MNDKHLIDKDEDALKKVFQKCNIEWLQSLQKEINTNFEKIQKIHDGSKERTIILSPEEQKREIQSDKGPEEMSHLSEVGSISSTKAEYHSKYD